jgi:isopenicillin-N N-acyltransferase-like protein
MSMPADPPRQFTLAGNWLDMGIQLGRLQSDDIRHFNSHYFSSMANLLRFGSPDRVWPYAATIVDQIRDCSDSCFAFLQGLAEGAKMPLDQLVAQAALPELTHVSHSSDLQGQACTACFLGANTNTTKAALVAENIDFNIDLPPWYVLKLCPSDGPAMLLVGAGAMFAVCGVNDAGLAATFTSSGHLPNVRPKAGLPVVALILETLSTHDYFDAMSVAAGPPRAGAFNMLITAAHGRGCLIEAVPDHLDIIEDKTMLICGNHFQHPNMIEKTAQDLNPSEEPAREFSRSSLSRVERLRELLSPSVENGAIELNFLIRCLADHQNHPLSICAHSEQTILGFATRGSVILQPGDRALQLCVTHPCSGSYFSYKI